MKYTVSTTDTGGIQLNVADETRSVLQNVAVILATGKGIVPLYRDFGVERSFLDQPVPVAKVRMVAAIREAVETWEPRARVTGVQFSEEDTEKGVLVPTVEVEIDE